MTHVNKPIQCHYQNSNNSEAWPSSNPEQRDSQLKRKFEEGLLSADMRQFLRLHAPNDSFDTTVTKARQFYDASEAVKPKKSVRILAVPDHDAAVASLTAEQAILQGMETVARTLGEKLERILHIRKSDDRSSPTSRLDRSNTADDGSTRPKRFYSPSSGNSNMQYSSRSPSPAQTSRQTREYQNNSSRYQSSFSRSLSPAYRTQPFRSDYRPPPTGQRFRSPSPGWNNNQPRPQFSKHRSPSPGWTRSQSRPESPTYRSGTNFDRPRQTGPLQDSPENQQQVDACSTSPVRKGCWVCHRRGCHSRNHSFDQPLENAEQRGSASNQGQVQQLPHNQTQLSGNRPGDLAAGPRAPARPPCPASN